MDVNALIQSTSVILISVAWKIVGAVALWLIGRWVINRALGLIGQTAAKQRLDETLTRYMQTALKILLNAALIVAMILVGGPIRGTPAGKQWKFVSSTLPFTSR